MQKTRVHRGRSYKSSQRRKQLMIKRYTVLGLMLALIVGVILLCVAVCSGNNDTPTEPVEGTPLTSTPTVSMEAEEITVITEPTDPSQETTEPVQNTTSSTEETEAPVCGEGDPNNRSYTYSTMSTEWGAEIYEQGWKYYEIPSSYTMYGGMFPEVAQVYLWELCREAGVDYYMVLALIERESGYRYDATGDSGNSKGLMQIYEKFHRERMEELDATELYNPYSNMRVGVDFLAEIQDSYSSSGEHCVLMVYNMGTTGAKKLWAQGIYSTSYSRGILQRAQEIKQELQDQ